MPIDVEIAAEEIQYNKKINDWMDCHAPGDVLLIKFEQWEAYLLDEEKLQIQSNKLPQYLKEVTLPDTNTTLVEIDVPADGTCLFYCVVLSVLLPIINDQNAFFTSFKKLFGEDLEIEASNQLKNFLYNYTGGQELIKNDDAQLESLVDNNFRKRVVEYMKAHKEIFSQQEYTEEKNFDEAMNTMLKTKTWGGHRELQAMSDFLERNFRNYEYKNDQLSLNANYSKDNYLDTIYLIHTSAQKESEINNHYHYLLPQQHIPGISRLLSQQKNSVKKTIKKAVIEVNSELGKLLTDIKPANVDSLDKNVLQNLIKQLAFEAYTPSPASSKRYKFDPEQKESKELIQHDSKWHAALNTLKMSVDIIELFTNLFNPREINSIKQNESLIIDGKNLVLGNFPDYEDLLKRAKEIAKAISSTSEHPRYKYSESCIIIELMVRMAMKLRPQYFQPIANGGLLTIDTAIGVIHQLINEFIKNGALEIWKLNITKTLQDEVTDQSVIEANLEFLNLIVEAIKYLGSEAIFDPLQDPLNKGIDAEKIKKAMDLEEWLKTNSNNRETIEYITNLKEFERINKHIEISRNRILNEFHQKMFSLLKKLDPEHKNIKTVYQLEALYAKKYHAKKRKDFENYINKIFNEPDPFESNTLRKFWEEVYRQQYGKVCYEVVYESFEDKNIGSAIHHKVQQIWMLSHLDTIHNDPKEARSRMTNASIDGLPAPNFGYDMPRSEAYVNWIGKNSFARECADVIMDAFHFLVDLGVKLDIELFLKKFINWIDDIYESDDSEYLHFSPFMVPFEQYLLKRELHLYYRRLDDALADKALTKEDLISKAKEVLNNFNIFSKNLLELRPSQEQSEEKSVAAIQHEDGFVFGIGFNGEIFGIEKNIEENNNEIWLSFSETGRKPGGYLFLYFLRSLAKSDRTEDINILNINLSAQNLIKYKNLITNNSKSVPDDKLKDWIKNPLKWYFIPAFIYIQIPDDMPKAEYKVQQSARELLFDAINKRSFSNEYPTLMPSLFLHWKSELLNLLSNPQSVILNQFQRIENKDQLIQEIKDAKELEKISDDNQNMVKQLLDLLVWQVDIELSKMWYPDISKKFELFKKPNSDKIKDSLDAAIIKFNKLNKNLEKSARSNQNQNNLTKLNELIKLTSDDIQKLKVEQKSIVDNPKDLAQDDYIKFKHFFFKIKREVGKCVEPVFARVLGHDRFFSVFISKKVKKTKILDQHQQPLQLGNNFPQDVIPPCDTRCQIHALGHLYTGDMLTEQSADVLDQMRRTHQLGKVPDRYRPLSNIIKK